jgi:hypothetical protein
MSLLFAEILASSWILLLLENHTAKSAVLKTSNSSVIMHLFVLNFAVLTVFVYVELAFVMLDGRESIA